MKVRPMRPSEDLRRAGEDTKTNRGRFSPTPDMISLRQEYYRMLEARKRGEAPMYITSTGKRYG